MGAFCTEENLNDQPLLLYWGFGKSTCLVEMVSSRRRPNPMAWPDHRRPLLGIIMDVLLVGGSRKIF